MLSYLRTVPLDSAIAALLAATVLGACASRPDSTASPTTISVVGTNDVHGEFLPKAGGGGLATIAGYVNALRSARDDMRLLPGDQVVIPRQPNTVEGSGNVNREALIRFAKVSR